jgi:hypothetical protein
MKFGITVLFFMSGIKNELSSGSENRVLSVNSAITLYNLVFCLYHFAQGLFNVKQKLFKI